MNIDYSFEEKVAFLKATGKYEVKEADVWEKQSRYHNQVETIESKMIVAIPIPWGYDIETFCKENQRYSVEYNIGINNTFEREFKKALLKVVSAEACLLD